MSLRKIKRREKEMFNFKRLVVEVVLITGLMVIFPAFLLGEEKSLYDLIPEGEGKVGCSQSKSWDFPSLPLKEKERTVLELEVRLDWENLAGATYVMGLTLNDKPIEPAKNRLENRLINKPLTIKFQRGDEMPWYVPGNGWTVYYSPDFKSAKDDSYEYKPREGDPYFFSIDVTDLVNTSSPNTLKITHLIVEYYAKKYWEEKRPALVFKTLRVKKEIIKEEEEKKDIIPQKNEDEKAEIETKKELKIEVPSPSYIVLPPLEEGKIDTSYDLKLEKGGGFKIIVGGETYLVESFYSYSNGGENKLLSGESSEGEKDWQVDTKKIDSSTYLVSGKSKYYTIERKILLEPTRIEVQDKIQNNTSEELGIIIRNYVDTKGKEIADAYLSGDKDPTKTISTTSWYNRNNPTIFISKKGLGLGLIALDDVYRVQSKISFIEEKASIFTDTFGMDKKASYTLNWAIYPSNSSDYFDFINQVRRDEGLNRKVDGGFSFTVRDKTAAIPDNLEKIVRSGGVKYLCTGSWYIPRTGNAKFAEPYIEGASLLSFPEEQSAWKRITESIHKIIPEVKVFFHIEPSLNEDPSFQTRCKDARAIDSDGNQYMYPGYDKPEYWGPYYEKGWRMWNYYATLDNSYYPVLCEVVDLLMDKCGNDGVYFDGFMGQNWDYTYDCWDGHTVLIDPKTKTIKRKMATMQLISQPAHLALARRIKEKGGVVIANGGPATRKMSKAEGIIWFSESPSHGILNLSPTPISLGTERTTDVIGDIRQKLEHGALYYYYYPKWPAIIETHQMITTQMFPITIQEIYPGYIKGDERLITKNSGIYGWHGDEGLHFGYLYDENGTLTPNNFLTSIDSYGIRTKVALKDKEIAVLKKIPVAISTLKPINLITQQYDEKGIQFTLSGEGEFEFKIRSGDFQIKSLTAYEITSSYFIIGAKTSDKKIVNSDKDGILSFSLTLSDNLQVKVEPSESK